MDEIRALQKKLADAVAGAATTRLSERNVVELVQKLRTSGFLDDLIYTSDGKEYLTRKQLELEMGDELLTRGGRVNIVDLPIALNVDMAHIESQASDLVKGKRGEIRIIGGEIVASYYLDTMMEEINELLSEIGQISLDELAKRFGFASGFLQDVIESRLGTLILGKLENGVLYTQAHIDRLKARIIGAFTGATIPVPVSQLRKVSGLSGESEPVFFAILEELIENGRINGVLQGRRDKCTYVPTVFSRTQHMWVESFFSENSHIDYDSLSRLQISNPLSYLKREFGSAGVPLDFCFVANHITANVDASISEIAEWRSEGSDNQSTSAVLDVMTAVPFSITVADCITLLRECESLEKLGARVITLTDDNAVYIISGNFVNEVLQKVETVCAEEEAKHHSSQMAQKERSPITSIEKSVKSREAIEEVIPVQERSGRKRGKNRRRRGSDAMEDLEGAVDVLLASVDKDVDFPVSKSKKGGRRGKKDRQKKGIQNESVIERRPEQSSSALAIPEFTASRISELLSVWFPGLCEENPFLACLLADHVLSQALSIQERVHREVFIRASVDRRKKLQHWLDTLASQLCSLHVHSKALVHLRSIMKEEEGTDSKKEEDKVEDLSVPLELHLIKSVGTSVVYSLLGIVALGTFFGLPYPYKTDASMVGNDIDVKQLPGNRAEADALLKTLKPDQMSIISKALVSITGKAVQIASVHAAMMAVCEKCDVFVPPYDRKKEKQYILLTKTSWRESLEIELVPAEILRLCTSILFTDRYRYALLIPGRSVNFVIDTIAPDMTSTALYHLKTVRDLVIKSFHSDEAEIKDSDEEEVDFNNTLIEASEKLREFVLKDTV